MLLGASDFGDKLSDDIDLFVICYPRMNDICITKVDGFRGITMESLVRRYIVTKGQEKPLLDACIIFPSVINGAQYVAKYAFHGMGWVT